MSKTKINAKKTEESFIATNARTEINKKDKNSRAIMSLSH